MFQQVQTSLQEHVDKHGGWQNEEDEKILQAQPVERKIATSSPSYVI